MDKPKAAVIGYDSHSAGEAEPPGAIVEALKGRLPHGVDLRLADDAGELARLWRDYGAVIVADSLTPAGSPGMVRVWDARGLEPQTEAQFRQMNGVALDAAIARDRDEDALPDSLLVVGVEGRVGGCGVGICPEVAEGVREAVDWVLMQLAVRLAA